MTHLRQNLVLQFSVASFGIMILVAILLAAMLTQRLNHNVDLLREHGEAMRAGTKIVDTDRYSIPHLVADIGTVQSITYGGIAAGYLFLYATLVTIVWRGWKIINKQRSDLQAAQIRALSQSKLATLGEVATGVAHEINQPLTYIRTTVQTLLEDFGLDDVDAESALKQLAESDRQVDRITAIVDHLRTFGRADDTEMAPLQIEAVLDDTLTLLGERIRNLGIDLQRATAPGIPTINGNRSQIEQVFINLFQNSIDALADTKSGALIGVSIRTPPDRSEAEVVFSDNGNGIAQEDIDRVFQPFFTTKEPGKGTGLGLSIAYSIIMEHGGSITCDSEPGKGTTITFRIPAAS